MTRSTNTKVTRSRRKKILKLAKGFIGIKHRSFKSAKEQLMHSWVNAFRDRKYRKRNARRLWITRINNSLKKYNDSLKDKNNKLSYSQFIYRLKLSQVQINRKRLSEMSTHNFENFTALVSNVRNVKPKESN